MPARLVCCLAATLAIGAARPIGAARAAAVDVSASLSPERLGRSTTIAFGFDVVDPAGELPRPLTGMSLLLPAGLSVATSELGLANCTTAELEAKGPRGCPSNAEIGHGTATAEVPFGGILLAERVAITLYSAPLKEGRPQILVFASGSHPVIANIVFPGSIAPASTPFGSAIETPMPPVPGLPGGPDVAIVSMRTTIGPAGLTYTERLKGRTIRFHPAGVVLPRRCPPGGFPFAADLGFADGTTSTSRTAVPCPRRASSTGRTRKRSNRSQTPRRSG